MSMQNEARDVMVAACTHGGLTRRTGGFVRRFVLIWMLLLAGVVVLIKPQTGYCAEPWLGMWVWSEKWISTDTEQDRLIEFCKQYGINRLLVNVQYDWDESEPAVPNIRLPEEFTRLLAKAHEAGITIEALDSEIHIGPEEQAKLMARLSKLLEFNATLPADARFVGIHYDIEPHVTDVFKESYESREVVMRNMLTFFAGVNAKLRLEAPEMILSCDIPMWLDLRNEGDRSCRLEFLGVDKNLHEHLQDMTDYVGVMSYRRIALGEDSVTEHVKTEIDYANKIGRGVCAGVETGKRTADARESNVISFYGLPSDFFWGEVKKIQETYKDQPSYRGLLIHSYRRFQEYLADNPPKGDQQMQGESEAEKRD